LSSAGRSSALAGLANAPMQQAIKDKNTSGLTLPRKHFATILRLAPKRVADSANVKKAAYQRSTML
jgi:hypothetical protein